MIKVRYLYKIIPIKRKMNTNKLPFEIEVIGFWGFIFKVLKINTFGKVYRYYGNYFYGIKSQYKFDKRKSVSFSITIKEDKNWEIYNDLKKWANR